MNIGMVGGLDRNAWRLMEAARAAGHTLEIHSGRTGGGVGGLERLVERSDLVIIVIEVNSHGAALYAKDCARKHQRPAMTLRKGSASAFARILRELPQAA